MNVPPVGRFAPSPTGELHFGSLLTAVASYCHVKSQHGTWLLRMEDTDWQRCHEKYAHSILKTLAAYGLHTDADVLYQCKRIRIYQEATEALLLKNRAYACECSRKSIQAYIQAKQLTQTTYPLLCRHKKLPDSPKNPFNIRLFTKDVQHTIADIIQGTQKLNPHLLLGDMVIRRRDGIYNYILTSVIDDAEQGVTQVVRGLDLLNLTPCQQQIAAALSLPQPTRYGHLPLALNKAGQKLSKQNKASSVSTQPKEIAHTLQAVLTALRQPKVIIDKPENMLAQAIAQWTLSPLQNQTQVN